MFNKNNQHLLNYIKVGKNLELRIYRAPFDWGRSREKIEWLSEEKPFFEREIFQFWKIYSSFPEGRRIELPVLESIDERRDFIKKPLIVALNGGKTVGGAWFRFETKKNKVLDCFMHLKVLRNERKIAKPLLDYTLGYLKKRSPCVSSSWCYREPEDNPSSFFKRNGFIVQGDQERSTAYKNLQ